MPVPVDEVSIEPLFGVSGPCHAIDDVEAIFYSASAVQSFASASDRAAFRERWLGRYLDSDPELAFVAVNTSGGVVGYIVGATDDPSLAPRFADIAFFQGWRDLTAVYPAHLHVNLAEKARGRGIGARLVTTFCVAAQARGVTGVHVVTGAAARNVGFYRRAGFAEAGRRARPTGDIVFMARVL